MTQPKGIRLLTSCLNMRRQLSKIISDGNLSHGEYLVLRNIQMPNPLYSVGDSKANLKAADLSELMDLSRPSITRILNGLEQRGLILRSIDKNDRRSVVIELTEKGSEALRNANKAILNVAGKLVESLGDSDTEKLIELMDKLTGIYKSMLEYKESEING